MSNPYSQDPYQQPQGQQQPDGREPYGYAPYGQQQAPAPYQNPYEQNQPGQMPYGPYGGNQFPAQDPGQTMGIVGLILSFVFAPAGLVVSHIAKKQSKEAGFDNGLAKAGFIISLIFTIIYVVSFVAYIVGMILIFALAGTGY